MAARRGGLDKYPGLLRMCNTTRELEIETAGNSIRNVTKENNNLLSRSLSLPSRQSAPESLLAGYQI